jgi:hypothetical protein
VSPGRVTLEVLLPEREGPALTWPSVVDRAALLPEDTVLEQPVEQAEPVADPPQIPTAELFDFDIEVARQRVDLPEIDPYVALDAATVPAVGTREAQSITVPGGV